MKDYIRKLTLGAICVVMIGGCATPQSVRTLSAEQVKVQESYLESQKEYFKLIERFVDTQIKTTESLINIATSEINAKYKKKAFREINSSDSQKIKKALDELENNLLSEQKSDQASLRKIRGYYENLKEQHKKMLLALEAILVAQKKLNDYIQLQKADEVAINQLLATVGLEKEKVKEAAKTVSTIYSEIEKYITKGAGK